MAPPRAACRSHPTAARRRGGPAARRSGARAASQSPCPRACFGRLAHAAPRRLGEERPPRRRGRGRPEPIREPLGRTLGPTVRRRCLRVPPFRRAASRRLRGEVRAFGVSLRPRADLPRCHMVAGRWRLVGWSGLRCPLPLSLAPKIKARGDDVDGRYRFTVVVLHRWVRLLFAYRGWLWGDRPDRHNGCGDAGGPWVMCRFGTDRARG